MKNKIERLVTWVTGSRPGYLSEKPWPSPAWAFSPTGEMDGFRLELPTAPHCARRAMQRLRMGFRYRMLDPTPTTVSNGSATPETK